jgi:hypothetical protein
MTRTPLNIRIDKYFPNGGDIHDVYEAGSIRAARAILKAVEIRRDEVRRVNETEPVISDAINKDFRFKLGMVYALNWILELPEQARIYINTLPDKEI